MPQCVHLNIIFWSGKLEICFDFGNWKAVFCILTAVSKTRFELIDLEIDEDSSLHYACSGHDFQNQF